MDCEIGGLPIIVSFFGGPCIGKSAMAADLFARLKWRGINCELVTEYAKDKVWERSLHTLKNQIFVFSQQMHRFWRLQDQVDIIITDSPFLLSVVYDADKNPALKRLVLHEFDKVNSLNFVIERNRPYYTKGRFHTEEEALQIDKDVENLLRENQIPYEYVLGGPDSMAGVEQTVLERLEHEITQLEEIENLI